MINAKNKKLLKRIREIEDEFLIESKRITDKRNQELYKLLVGENDSLYGE